MLAIVLSFSLFSLFSFLFLLLSIPLLSLLPSPTLLFSSICFLHSPDSFILRLSFSHRSSSSLISPPFPSLLPGHWAKEASLWLRLLHKEKGGISKHHDIHGHGELACTIKHLPVRRRCDPGLDDEHLTASSSIKVITWLLTALLREGSRKDASNFWYLFESYVSLA